MTAEKLAYLRAMVECANLDEPMVVAPLVMLDLLAERDALAARVAALEAALRPAWAIAGYANDGPWGNGGPYSQDVWGVDDRYICTTSDADDANLIVAAVNAVRAARDTHP